MKILSLLGKVFAAFSVATVLACGSGIGYLWMQGNLTPEKRQLLAMVLYDVNLDEMRAAAREPDTAAEEQVSRDEVIERRALAGLDLELREQATNKGLLDLRSIEESLRIERNRYSQLKKSFDTRLAELEQNLQDEAILEVQRTLESIQPRQAKDQILMMLEEDQRNGGEKAMEDVVAIMTNMPLDKRRKIIGEFKEGEDPQKLHEILLRIRLGEPDVGLIQQTREELKGV